MIGEGRYCDVYCGIEEKDNEEDDVKGKWYAIKIDKRKHEFRTRQKVYGRMTSGRITVD